MKKIITLILSLCLLFCFTVTAFADETDVLIEEETTVTDTGTNVYVDNDVIISKGENILTGVNTYTSRSITPEGTYGLKSALLSVLGDYEAIIVEYEYQNTGDSSITYERTVQPDYVWLCSAGVLALFVFCLFKLGVAAWKR